VSAPILVGYVYPLFGVGGVFAMTTAVLVIGAGVVLIFGIETRNRSLEDIEAQELGSDHSRTTLRPAKGMHS